MATIIHNLKEQRVDSVLGTSLATIIIYNNYYVLNAYATVLSITNVKLSLQQKMIILTCSYL